MTSASSITDIHYQILFLPLLQTKWLALEFSDLRSILIKYFNEQTVNEICDETSTVDKKTFVKNFLRKVLQKDDDNLYMDIVYYCEEKCKCISELLNIMWMDVDDGKKNTDDDDNSMTENQYEILLTNHSVVKEKLQLCLNENKILYLMKKYCEGEQQKPPTGTFLHRMLLKKDSKEFYDEVCKLLKMEYNKFKDCHNLMNNEDVQHYEQDNQQVKVQVPPPSSADWIITCPSSHDVVLMKTQLEESKHTMQSVANGLSEELCEFKKEINQTASELETKVIQQMNLFSSEWKTTREECNAKIESIRNETKISLDVLSRQITVPNYPFNVNIYDIAGNLLGTYSMYSSQTLLDLKRRICISKFSHTRTEEIKFIYYGTLLVDDNETLYKHGLVEGCSIKYLLKSSSNLVKVFVKDKNMKSEEFTVSTSGYVMWLKAEYSERTGMLLSDIRLLSASSALMVDSLALSSYSITNNSIIFLS